MTRPRHPNKEIEAAVREAEALGWRFRKGHGHAWGVLYCPHGERGGCVKSVYSTPVRPENHAREIRRAAERCPHRHALLTGGEEE